MTKRKDVFSGTSYRRHDLLIVTTTCNKISKIVKISNGQLVTRTFLGEDWLHFEQLAASDTFFFLLASADVLLLQKFDVFFSK